MPPFAPLKMNPRKMGMKSNVAPTSIGSTRRTYMTAATMRSTTSPAIKMI
jgi:hypothetical protein